MTSLYTKDTVIGKLWKEISQIFSKETKPTRQHLFEMILSVFALNGFQSVKCSFEHFINEVSEFQLKSFYYTLNEGKIALTDWMKNLIVLALSLSQKISSQPIILSVDDTLVEKYGKHFAHWSKLFDHAAHHGSNYLNGHCFVSLELSLPVQDHSDRHYISFPLACLMWTKEHSKLELAAQLVKNAMDCLGNTRQVILCCDSWYPKGCLKDLVNEYPNLTLICNVRSDTAIFALPSPKSGKKGRPQVRGQKLSLHDFALHEVPGTGYLVGARPVMTMLFAQRMVYAVVTKSKKSDSFRLFLSSADPSALPFDLSFSDTKAAAFARSNPDFLPLTIYALRWNIEVSFYERKTFWAFSDYRLRSHTGIERLINLLSLCCALSKILPFLLPDFSPLTGSSAQQVRFALGKCIRQQVFFASLPPLIHSLFIHSSDIFPSPSPSPVPF